jgi:hypothetical protein
VIKDVTGVDIEKDFCIDLDLKSKNQTKETWDTDKNDYVTSTIKVSLNKAE